MKHIIIIYIGSSFIRLPKIMWACETHAETCRIQKWLVSGMWSAECRVQCTPPIYLYMYVCMEVLMHLDTLTPRFDGKREKKNHFRLGSDDTEKLLEHSFGKWKHILRRVRFSFWDMCGHRITSNVGWKTFRCQSIARTNESLACERKLIFVFLLFLVSFNFFSSYVQPSDNNHVILMFQVLFTTTQMTKNFVDTQLIEIRQSSMEQRAQI